MSKIDSFVKGIPRGLRAIEIVAGENVAGLVSMFGGILPAGIAFNGMTDVLGFKLWLAWAGVVIIEGLNLGATSTALILWKRGQMKRFWIALAAVLFYLVSIITVNVILDDGPATHKWAKALLSSVSIVGAVVVALRMSMRNDDERSQAQIAVDAKAKEGADAHARKLEEEKIAFERETQKEKLEAQRLASAERRQNKQALEMAKLKVSESFGETESSAEKGKVSESYPDWRKVPTSVRERIAKMERWEDVAAEFGKKRKTAQGWLKGAREEFPQGGE